MSKQVVEDEIHEGETVTIEAEPCPGGPLLRISADGVTLAGVGVDYFDGQLSVLIFEGEHGEAELVWRESRASLEAKAKEVA